MTPLWKHPEPDDRPTRSEVAGAVFIAILIAALLFAVGAVNLNLPGVTP